VVAVPAGEEEHLLLPVLLGVQDVVAAMPCQERAEQVSKEASRQQRRRQRLTIHGKTSWYSWLLTGWESLLCFTDELTPVLPSCKILFLVVSGGGAEVNRIPLCRKWLIGNGDLVRASEEVSRHKVKR
jgi:hypothetical protein